MFSHRADGRARAGQPRVRVARRGQPRPPVERPSSGRMRPAIFSGPSTAGSPKASTPQISNRQRQFWTSSTERLGLLQSKWLRYTGSRSRHGAFVAGVGANQCEDFSCAMRRTLPARYSGGPTSLHDLRAWVRPYLWSEIDRARHHGGGQRDASFGSFHQALAVVCVGAPGGKCKRMRGGLHQPKLPQRSLGDRDADSAVR